MELRHQIVKLIKEKYRGGHRKVYNEERITENGVVQVIQRSLQNIVSRKNKEQYTPDLQKFTRK